MVFFLKHFYFINGVNKINLPSVTANKISVQKSEREGGGGKLLWL